MARILALVTDLMLASRVDGSLSAAGHEVTVRSGLDDETVGELAQGRYAAVICDLEAVDAVAVGGLDLPSLGFYSHVETETRARAIEAGIDSVVPRSRMSRELPELTSRLIDD